MTGNMYGFNMSTIIGTDLDGNAYLVEGSTEVDGTPYIPELPSELLIPEVPPEEIIYLPDELSPTTEGKEMNITAEFSITPPESAVDNDSLNSTENIDKRNAVTDQNGEESTNKNIFDNRAK